ncbi:ribonuclease H-like domain-containing protein [Tanacetum coccineum]
MWICSPSKDDMDKNESFIRRCNPIVSQVDVSEADLDVIDLDSFSSDLEDGVDIDALLGFIGTTKFTSLPPLGHFCFRLLAHDAFKLRYWFTDELKVHSLLAKEVQCAVMSWLRLNVGGDNLVISPISETTPSLLPIGTSYDHLPIHSCSGVRPATIAFAPTTCSMLSRINSIYYALWDVIENRNSFKPVPQTTTNVDGSSTSLILGPVTTEEKVQKKNDMKARSMLLMALPNEHLMTFNKFKDAKTLFAAIQTRFGGNEAPKKTQKNLLKQIYENFSAPSTESLDSIFNILQKIVSQLAIMGENISQEDINLKSLRKVKGIASSSYQNMAFVSSPSSTNEVNTAYGVSTANTQVSPASTQVSTASTQVSTANLNDIEEIDLKWQLALLSIRTRSFFQKTGRKITINGSDTARYDKSKVECFNCHKMGYFTRECRGPRNQDNRNRNQNSSRRTINVEETSSKAMVTIDGADSEVHNDKTCLKTCLKDFETLKTQLDDLRIEFNKSEFNLATYKRGLTSVEEQLVFYKKNEVIFCKQLVVLKRDISYKDSEINMLKSELEKLKQEKESNQLKIENFDNASKSLDKLIGSQITDKSRIGVGFVSYNVVPPPPTGLFSPPKFDLSNSSLEKLQQPEFEGYGPKTSKSVSEDISNEGMESPDALLVKKLVLNDKLEKKTVFSIVAKIEFANCNYHQKERVVSRNNYTRVNYNYSAKKAHPSAHRNMVPKAVLMKTGIRSLNTARPVNTAHPKTTIYSARPMSHFSKSAQSTSHPQKEDQGYVDSGFSRHMTANMSYLSNFKEFDGGYVTFRGGAKGRKITGKGTLKTGEEAHAYFGEAPSTSHSPPPHIILSHTRADTPPSGTAPSGTPPLLPIPLPTSSSSLLLPSTDHEADRPEVCLPLWKRLCFAFGPSYEVGESSYDAAARLNGGLRADYGFVSTMDRAIMRDLERDVGYVITDTWDEMLVDMSGALTTDNTELGRWMTDFTTRVRQDTNEIYTRLDDEQTERQLMAGRLNMLYRDRRAHARTARLIEAEARMSREAWG